MTFSLLRHESVWSLERREDRCGVVYCGLGGVLCFMIWSRLVSSYLSCLALLSGCVGCLSCFLLSFILLFIMFSPPPPLTVPTATSHWFVVCLLSFLCVCLPAKPRLVLSWLPLVLSCFVVCLCWSCFVVCWYRLALLSACVCCLCWLLVLSSPTLNLKPNP